MTFKTFRKKPVSIWAAKWDGTTEGATPIIDWILANDGTARYECSDPIRCEKYDGDCPHYIAIDTLEGAMRASVGDWIIRGVQGEFYPCKPDIFAQTYDDRVGPLCVTPGLYRFPPVDPVTGEVSIATDAILMGELRHCDVPELHRRDDCAHLMRLHGWIDDGSSLGIVLCPRPI